MRKYSITAMALILLASTVQAESKLDLGSRMALHRLRIEQNGLSNAAKALDGRRSAPSATGRVGAFVTLAEGMTAADLEAEGMSVSFVRGDIAVVGMPLSEVERMAESHAIRSMQLARDIRPAMDLARTSAGVSRIHAGEDLPKAYTGRGVTVGTVDQGMDASHINFKDEDEKSRFIYLSHVYADSKADYGYAQIQYGPENIDQFTTDTDETFHATHTTGILAGSYRGKVNAGIRENSLSGRVEEIDNPFYGVAYEADIASSCGDLQDIMIAQGVENIINASNQPTVISLSLGSTLGPHDSRSTMCRFLDLAAEDAIICLSAGNEGDLPIAVKKELTESDTEVKTFIEAYAMPAGNVRYGQVYIYSDDDTPFEMQAVIYNRRRGTIAYRMPVQPGQEEGVPQYYASVNTSGSDITSASFSRAFDNNSYVGVGWLIDPVNEAAGTGTGRYYNIIDYYTRDNSSTNASGDYVLGFVVTGKPGQKIEAYCDGSFTCFNNYATEGYDPGSTDGSISDMACGNDVLIVGSYNTRDDWASIDGGVYGYHGRFPAGKVSSFSSYGTLSDGRELPHICGPGAAIISSTNSYFVENAENNVEEADIQAIAARPERRNYWQQAVGTSMSTPFVAGSIALWLEANPYLTIDDVKRIVAETAVRDEDYDEAERVRWGAGKFNAYDGLKEAIRLSGEINTVAPSADSRLMVRPLSGSSYEVFLGGVAAIEASVYNVAGAKVLEASAGADQLIFDASALDAGVYILNVNGSHSQKITIK